MKNRNSSFGRKFKTLAALLALTPILAQAHPGHGETVGFTSGLSHPLLGADHILAMVALGLWAAQNGRPFSLPFRVSEILFLAQDYR